MINRPKLKLAATITCYFFLSVTHAGYSSSSTPNNSYSSSGSGSNGYYSSSGSVTTTQSPESGYRSDAHHQRTQYSVTSPASIAAPISINPHHRHHHNHPYLPEWIIKNSSRYVPMDAVIGGQSNGQTLYVCRAPFRGGIHPGKLTSDGLCRISWGGNVITPNQFDVLVSQTPVHWAFASFGALPRHAVAGGYENGRTLYVCQVNYRGNRLPGKLINNKCHFAYDGQEIRTGDYQVLVS